MAKLIIDTEEVEQIAQRLTQVGGNAENAINEVLHGIGGQMIEEEIHRILPQSGRTWTGKKKAAVKAKPFTRINKNLEVTVKTKSNYHYLYFPDNGENTKYHVGFHGIPREFMRRGAENRKQEIINMCIETITNELED